MKDYAHQTKAIKFHLNRNYSMDASEPGTGKTRVAILTALSRMQSDEVSKVLIICPNSLLWTWRDEIWKHGNRKSIVVTGNRSEKLRRLNLRGRLFILSYESTIIKPIFQKIQDLKFGMGVWDESGSYLKNSQSKRSQMNYIIGGNLKFKLMLTGTPITDSILDIYSQYKVLDGGKTFGTNYFKFFRYLYRPVLQYRPGKTTYYQGGYWVAKAGANKAIQQKVAPSLIRFKAEDCILFNQMIETDKGWLRIQDIVEQQIHVNVKTFNGKEIEWKPIVNWYDNGNCNECLSVKTLPRGQKQGLRVFSNHRFIVPGGEIRADNLRVNDTIYMSTEGLSYDQEQIVIGSLLGDGGLLSNRRSIGDNFSFKEIHGKTQVYYLKWKRESLCSLFPSEIFFNSKKQGSFRTKHSARLWEFGREFYKDGGKKVLSKKYLYKLGKLGLAVWIMDDGDLSFIGRYRTTPNIKIATSSFSLTENEIIQKWFKDIYGWKCWIINKQKYPRLSFDAKSSREIVDYVSEYLIFNKTLKQFLCPKILTKKIDVIKTQVRSITSIKFPKKLRKFDLEIKDNHNYFAQGILVHNCLDLPEQIFIKRYAEWKMRSEQHNDYMEIYMELVTSLTKQLKDTSLDDLLLKEVYVDINTALGKMSKLQQICSGFLYGVENYKEGARGTYEYNTNPKLDALCEVLKEYLPIGKIIVYGQFVQDHSLIFSTPFREYMTNNVDEFTSLEQKRIFVSSPVTGGIGLNLQIANVMVFWNNPWGLEKRVQALGRIHRVGQKKKCIYIDLIMRNSIDEYILEKLENKWETAEAILRFLQFRPNIGSGTPEMDRY